MTNVLRLFQLQQHAATSVQTAPPVVVVKKRKNQEVQPIAKIEVVFYNCELCHQPILIDTVSPIQCSACTHRVVSKQRIRKPVSYDAI